MLKRTVKSCGPDASVVGVKSAEGKSAQPGADEPAIRRRRRQQSPILRGEREISRKAIAQGMSDRLRCPVCSCAFSFVHLHTRPRVQRASGIPCSLIFEGQRHANPGQNRAAGWRTHICCLTVEFKCHHVIASGAKQSISPSKERVDCFASLAMTLIG